MLSKRYWQPLKKNILHHRIVCYRKINNFVTKCMCRYDLIVAIAVIHRTDHNKNSAENTKFNKYRNIAQARTSAEGTDGMMPRTYT